MKVDNTSALPHHLWVWNDSRGREYASLLVKATFEMGATRAALQQEPIVVVDELRPSGSIKKPSDIAMRRTGTSIVLDASVCPRAGEEVWEAHALVRVGALEKRIVALGERRWWRHNGQWEITKPEPVRGIVTSLDNAFGGSRNGSAFDQNPFGKGYCGDADPSEGHPLPLLEDPASRIVKPSDRPRPASFDALPAVCLPRRARGGTYDEAWRRRRAPLPPDDFDDAFWDVAGDALVARPFLVGGEAVVLEGLSTTKGPIAFGLPRNLVRVEVDGVVNVPVVDLICFSLAKKTVSMTFRHTFEVTGLGYRLPRMTIRVLDRKGREREVEA